MFRRRSVLLATPWGTLGDLALAAFAWAVLSGAALAVPFNPGDAYGSIAGLLLGDPAGTFLRNIHYWSGQLFLILTLLHLWDHLWLGTELRVRQAVWLRLTLSLGVAGFLMLSGFLLRGDADAQQALRIVTRLLDGIPWLGSLAVTFLFGRGARLDALYLQHAATATILTWLLITEHARHLWPRPSAFLATGLAACALSLGLSPGLHDGLDPVVKGPWYFLGLQEILHWTRWPVLIVPASLLLVLLLAALRRMSADASRRAKRALLWLGAAYLLLCLVGGFFRGADWRWEAIWPRGDGNLQAGWVFARTVAAPVPLPAVQGRPEGCLVCHKDVTGLGDAHRPEALGCASCHGGNPLTLQPDRAHAGLRRVPGNLADAPRSCGLAGCHGDAVSRVQRSVMTTMSGVVAVDREVLGEGPAGQGEAFAHVAELTRTPADTHLRQLCASCHLGQKKTEPGPDGGDTPGGGCIACHLAYSPAAARALADYQHGGPGTAPPRLHPAVSVDVDGAKCFLCHSRSGRISTNYEGWMELHDPPERFRGTTAHPADPQHRTLADDRVFERAVPDIHHDKGLDCVDCHSAKEVMGDGEAHARKRGQQRLVCEDCHARPGGTLPDLPAAALDPESRRILALRKWPVPARFIRTDKGDALVNGTFDAAGRPVLLRKRTGEPLPLKSQTAACTAQGHRRLACGTCHTSWAPSCASCHTGYEPGGEAHDWLADANVRGAWRESSGPYEARPPTLGLQGEARVQTFVPGMILTVDGPGGTSRFRRLYARTEPHTTRRESRSCQSCHADPEALGYGKGRLAFERTPRGGRWTFTPALPPGPDGLPQDAWIPFLGTRPGPVSTRGDVRPFTVAEQRRILDVGACLTCHEGSSAVMTRALRDYPGTLARRRSQCLVPLWP